MPTPRSRACLLLIAVVVGAVVVGACGGGGDDTSNVTVPADPATTTADATTTTEATTTTTEDPKAAVEAAFYAQWDAFVEILSDPDPANPLIDRHFTGDAREALLDSISEFILENKRARRPVRAEDFAPSVLTVDIDGRSAVLFECTTDGIAIVKADTGEVINDEVRTYSLRNEFVFDSGRWKLADTRDPVEGEPSCVD